MSRLDVLEYLRRRLKESQDGLERLKAAVERHGLRVLERDIKGQRDVTDRHLIEAESACEEYRKLIDDWYGE